MKLRVPLDLHFLKRTLLLKAVGPWASHFIARSFLSSFSEMETFLCPSNCTGAQHTLVYIKIFHYISDQNGHNADNPS